MSNLFSTGGAGNVGASEGIDQQSLKFNDDDSQYLSWTPAAAGNRKTWTWSGWVKRGNIGTTQDIFIAGSNASGQLSTQFTITSGNILQIYSTISGSAAAILLQTTQVFRDVSAWYHIVLQANTTDGTASNRIKLYVNGEQVTSFSTATYPSQNYDTAINNNVIHTLGRFSVAAANHFDGYMSDIYFIDGQALDASSFGQFTNGYWEKKDYAGSYGTNGFHLTFADDVVSEGFNAVTYRGNGDTQSVSGIGFEPSFVWIKQRNGTGYHTLFDAVRGATKNLSSNSTDQEATLSNHLTAFNGDGFTLGGNGDVNGSGNSYVAWAWDVGSGSAASNTDGSITSTVKANPDYGFSIASYTGNGTAGATVGHGLSSAPEMIIVKIRSGFSGGTNWRVYHSALGATQNIRLNTNAAATSETDKWNDTAPTSSVFSLGNHVSVNENNATAIAYCFHSVAGYSKISSYQGTGSTHSVNLGFQPAFVMLKRTDSTFGWVMLDNTRDPDNIMNSRVDANSSGSESSGERLRFTSTGFDVTAGTDAAINNSGSTYIYIAFADTREAAFWKDVSGQGNHWTPNNLDYRDSVIDSPANNFAVMNPLANELNATLSEGNLRVIGTSNEKLIFSTFGVSSGKWYFEAYIENQELRGVVGITDDKGNDGYEYGQNYAQLSTYFGFLNTSATDSGENFSRGCQDGDVISFAIDADNGQVWIKLNSAVNTGSAAFATGLPTDTTYRVHYQDSYASNTIIKFNFGQDSTFSGARPAGGNTDGNDIGDFAYPVPSGYLALCTANLPTPSIVDGSDYFETVLYTGDGTSSNQISVNFAPDFTWMKPRNQARNHRLVDSVRGYPVLSSNLTDAEGAGGYLRLNSTGFLLTTSAQDYNGSGNTYAAWNWKAGGTAVSNTDGSITSQVSANTAAGFSIVSWVGDGTSQGATVGHSLAAVPSMIIVKSTDSDAGWNVWHKDLTNATTSRVLLNDTGDEFDSVYVWGSTAPDNSAFGVGTFGTTTWTNRLSRNYIAYCFANTEGYLKAGSYTGNGSSDGPFIYTGFRPAWIMIKNSNRAEPWVIRDTERDTYNTTAATLLADSSDAEFSWNQLDILSNGFKLRAGASEFNFNGEKMIFLAFAENPFKYANAR